MSTHVRCGCALFVVCSLAAVVTPSAYAGYDDAFRTPGGAAYCRMYFANYVWTDFACFTPNDGFFVKMTNVLYPERGFRITKGYRRGFRGYRNARAPLWGFGRTWYSSDAQVVTCVSRKSGLTCTHDRGHGWWLGRHRGYRVF